MKRIKTEKGKETKAEVVKVEYNLVNEAVLLASVIVDEKARKKYINLPNDIFFGPTHSEMWVAIQELFKKDLEYSKTTMQTFAGDKFDVETLDQYVKEFPAAPANLKHHVALIMWDKTRHEASRGILPLFIEAIKDNTTDPDRIKSLAAQLKDCFHGAGDLRYLREARNIVIENREELKNRREGYAIYPFGFEGFDNYENGKPRMVPGLAPGMVTAITGLSGCLSGDTIIELNRARKSFKLKLSEVVRRFNGGKAGGRVWDPDIHTDVRYRANDGTIRLGKLADAYESGIKIVYEIVTSGGKKIKATADHRFLEKSGWKKLSELRIDDYVYVENPNISSGEPKRKKGQYPVFLRLYGHPRASAKNAKSAYHRYTVPCHIIVYEANMNGISVEAYIEKLRTKDVKGLLFLDRTMVVHHKDQNTKNYDLNNLELHTMVNHSKLHGIEGAWKHVTARTYLERIISIREIGPEMTYDLAMESEPHNFMANGFVVHNSGKTSFTANLVLKQRDRKRKMLWGAWEQTSALSLELATAIDLGMSRTDLMTGNFNEDDQKEIEEKEIELGEYIKFFELPFGRTRGERGESLNDKNLDLIHQYIAESGCDIFIGDIFKAALKDRRPDDEAMAIERIKAIAMDCKAHIILIHHLNLKDVESRQDKRPTRNAVMGSSAWINSVDNAIALHCPRLFNHMLPNETMEIHILKQRHGKWPQAVEFDWNPEYCTLQNGRTLEVNMTGKEEPVNTFLSNDPEPERPRSWSRKNYK